MSDRIETAAVAKPTVQLEITPRSAVGHLILKSSVIVVAVTLLQKLLGLLLLRALALHYGPTTFGDWNTAFAFVGFFSIITDFGIDTIVVREASKKRPDLDRFIGTA